MFLCVCGYSLSQYLIELKLIFNITCKNYLCLYYPPSMTFLDNFFKDIFFTIVQLKLISFFIRHYPLKVTQLFHGVKAQEILKL